LSDLSGEIIVEAAQHGELGELLDVEIPCDREGTFDPVLIAKGERRIAGFDDKIVAMYARGMTVHKIQDCLQEQYGTEISPDFISSFVVAIAEPMPGGVFRWAKSALP